MSNTFKNANKEDVGTSDVTIYTVPASTTSVVIGLSVSNVLGSAMTVDVYIEDTSAGVTSHLVKTAPVPVGSALVVIGGDQKVVLETTDVIKVVASDASAADVVCSVMEIT